MTRFTGYAAVFDAPDRGGDVVRRGAFGTIGDVPLLWQHRGSPVGAIESIGEDARGLRVVGRIDDPRLATLVARGAVDGLSFGYRVRRSRRGARRELTAVNISGCGYFKRMLNPLPCQRLTAVN